jgi:hypothetical protein
LKAFEFGPWVIDESLQLLKLFYDHLNVALSQLWLQPYLHHLAKLLHQKPLV